MYLIYTDESGDPGVINSPSNFFILSGIVLHETNWSAILEDLVNFRRYLKDKYGILMKEEIHASELLSGRNYLKCGIHRYDKFRLLKECLTWLNSRSDISIITVRCDKRGKPVNVFEYSWSTFIQRMDNTLHHQNFPGPNNGDKAILIADNTDEKKLKSLLRKMRKHNYVPSSYNPTGRNIPLRTIIKDPILRDSKHSYFHQMADIVAYFARQSYECNSFVKKKGGKRYYETLLGNVTNPFATRKVGTINNIVEL